MSELPRPNPTPCPFGFAGVKGVLHRLTWYPSASCSPPKRCSCPPQRGLTPPLARHGCHSMDLPPVGGSGMVFKVSMKALAKAVGSVAACWWLCPWKCPKGAEPEPPQVPQGPRLSRLMRKKKKPRRGQTSPRIPQSLDGLQG